MAEISLGSVFDGITLALHSAFPNSQIHGDAVKRELSDGDIQVAGFISGFEGEPSEREKVTLNVTVAYYPSVEGGLAECLSAGERMKDTLLKIKTPEGDYLNGLSPSLDCGNGDRPVILTLKYTYFTRAEGVDDPIGELKIKFGGINV